MNDQKVAYAPFHAINQFMLEEFRQKVIRAVLAGLNDLPAERRKALNAQVKQNVTVPGFRDSSQAPAAVRLRPMEKAFEKSPHLAAQVLMTWSELYPELRTQVFDLLTERGWQVLPADADRTRLPGFIAGWPEKEDYDALGAAFAEKYPQAVVDENDLRLMIVWVGGRLPYNAVD